MTNETKHSYTNKTEHLQ